MDEIIITKDNITNICQQLNKFFEHHENIVITHDFDSGFNGRFDKYKHTPYSKCVWNVDSDGICRMRKDNKPITYIKEGMCIIIDGWFIVFKTVAPVNCGEHLYHLIYPDYVYIDGPEKDSTDVHDTGSVMHDYKDERHKFNPPPGYEDIAKAAKEWQESKKEMDTVLAGIGFYSAINRYQIAAKYMIFFKMISSKFGLVSRFAKFACKSIEDSYANGGFPAADSILDELEHRWFDMMFDWLKRTNTTRTVNIDEDYFIITRTGNHPDIIVSEQDIHNFLGVFGDQFGDSITGYNGVRYSIYHCGSRYECPLRIRKEHYTMYGEHRIISGRIDTCGKMEW